MKITTWEEIILEIRNNKNFDIIVKNSYLSENLVENIERYSKSDEFFEIKRYLINKGLDINKIRILDVGSGNGISAISFAINGASVVVCEPDNSSTVGINAIKYLSGVYKVDNLIEIHTCYFEELNVNKEFDLIFIRQAMHHAIDLNKFLNKASILLKKGGMLMTIRDHVLNDESLLEDFLEKHALHKYYGGEFAYTKIEYLNTMKANGFKNISCIEYYDSVINYFPKTKNEIEEKKIEKLSLFNNKLKRIFGFKSYLISNQLMKLFPSLQKYKYPNGRMISFIAIKP